MEFQADTPNESNLGIDKISLILVEVSWLSSGSSLALPFHICTSWDLVTENYITTDLILFQKYLQVCLGNSICM